ncbi:G patch domain-containing protein 3-like [Babylonia areolata]|uniref:G patch domain-containing protein 3-like n=1 Tax=Babylonia areolata TaxID=304850 RepID=UPI003FD0DEC3
MKMTEKEHHNISQSSSGVYAVVNNIPPFYRSADLRRFFSQFVETGGFDCFHFRHRPEKQSVKASLSETTSSSSDNKNDSETSSRGPFANDIKRETFCCIIRVSEVKFVELYRTYHQRNWQDSKGESVSSKCLISRLKTASFDLGDTTDKNTVTTSCGTVSRYQTRGEKRQIPADREEFREEDLQRLPELRPPTVMPHGNVGTPTMHFMKLIQECRLPPSIIKKLQLDFPKSKSKGKYGSVPFDYQTEVIETATGDEDVIGEKAEGETGCTESSSIHKSAGSNNLAKNISDTVPGIHNEEPSAEKTPLSSDNAPSYKEKRHLKKLAKQERRKLMAERIEEKMIEFEKGGSSSEDDNDTCEEWERHEAMYDDVSNQGRNKERLFEEEMEVVWEKGGSGLVFYTDAQYWQEKEGDFDEQTADDLDVDMSAYYEDGAGDPDIRDFLTIRQEQRRRRGIEKTDRFSAGIGKFEKHTKGVGRKILEKQGWTEGSGLGSSVQGIADALDTEGQHPKDRKGLGYRGEKLMRYGLSAQRKRKANSDVLISTVYDTPDDTDPLEPLWRRNDPSHIKHRDRIN